MSEENNLIESGKIGDKPVQQLDMAHLIGAPTDAEYQGIQQLAHDILELSNYDSELYKNNPLYVWSHLNGRYITVEEHEDSLENPVGDVTPERFKDLPQNDIPVVITQSDSGEILAVSVGDQKVIGISGGSQS